MDWSDILVILNTIDTCAGVLFAVGTWFGFRAWLRSRRHAQKGQDAVGSPGSEDSEEDEAPR